MYACMYVFMCSCIYMHVCTRSMHAPTHSCAGMRKVAVQKIFLAFMHMGCNWSGKAVKSPVQEASCPAHMRRLHPHDPPSAPGTGCCMVSKSTV